jgi:hypothetical protein
MSEYAVHFTKGAVADSAYDVMLKILWEGRILPGGPWGTARSLAELGDSQKSACFSEIPLDLLSRLIERRSLYGIGLHQRVLVERGGARVWYLDKDSPAAVSFQAIVRDAMTGGIDPVDAVWRLTPFVDNPGKYAEGAYRFEWEREWRVPGGITFTPDDVAFLFIPEDLHATARSFFEDHLRDHTGPAYLCPYVDPRWDMARIQTAFASVSATPVALPPPEALIDYGTCGYCGAMTADGLCLMCGRLSF